MRKQDGYYSIVSFFTRKKQHENPKGEKIWERSSQSNASQATNDQSKNGVSEKMLQETQEELIVPFDGNVNPLQSDVKSENEKNQDYIVTIKLDDFNKVNEAIFKDLSIKQTPPVHRFAKGVNNSSLSAKVPVYNSTANY